MILVKSEVYPSEPKPDLLRKESDRQHITEEQLSLLNTMQMSLIGPVLPIEFSVHNPIVIHTIRIFVLSQINLLCFMLYLTYLHFVHHTYYSQYKFLHHCIIILLGLLVSCNYFVQ